MHGCNWAFAYFHVANGERATSEPGSSQTGNLRWLNGVIAWLNTSHARLSMAMESVRRVVHQVPQVEASWCTPSVRITALEHHRANHDRGWVEQQFRPDGWPSLEITDDSLHEGNLCSQIIQFLWQVVQEGQSGRVGSNSSALENELGLVGQLPQDQAVGLGVRLHETVEV